MATPVLQPETPGPTWSDFTPRYSSLLAFIDVLYSAILSVGLVLIGLLFDHHFDHGGFDWAPFILLVFSNLYLVGDYVDARLFTARYEYKSLRRFWVDLIIGVVFFASFVTGYHSSPLFLPAMAGAFFLGGIWCFYLQRDAEDKRPLKFVSVVILGHLVPAIILFLLWRQHRYEHRLTIRDTMVAVGWYLIWSSAYVLAEIILNIPPKEADLLPQFPLGRIVRNARFIRTIRNKLVDSSINTVGRILHGAAERWDRITKRRDDRENGQQ